jgi:hypothetical protein
LLNGNDTKNATLAKITKIIYMDYSVNNSILITNSYTLRKLIGILGMAMPLLLTIFLFVDSGLNTPLESISHYYYTRVGSIFTIILSVLAIFLIVYKGKSLIDFIFSSVAGVFALFVVLFPTSNITDQCGDSSKNYVVTILRKSDLRVNFHYISAGIFLLCLAYMSIFLFTKSDKLPSERGSKKILRNRVYRICGVLMVLAVVIIASESIPIIPPTYYTMHKVTFWMETLAIESFGFAWLIKGGTLFKDES